MSCSWSRLFARRVSTAFAVTVIGAFCLGFDTRCLIAADPIPAAAVANHEYPMVVLAVASIDRLRDRADFFAQCAGKPELAATFYRMLQLTEVLAPLFEDECFDPSRPVGAMNFPKDPGAVDLSQVSVVDVFDADVLLDLLFGKSAFFFPVRDANRFVEKLGQLANETYLRVPGNPGFYQDEKGKIQNVRSLGNYVVFLQDEDPHRNFPDLDGILRPLLRNRDVVLSIQARGIPRQVRETWGTAIKLAAAATLQRYDEESELAFRWRTALGAFQQEFLEISLSHIEGLNLGLNIDPVKSEATFDLELVGLKNGRLAKLCSGLTARRSPFTVLAAQESPFTLAISTPFSPQLTRPLVEAFRSRPDFVPPDGVAPLGELLSTLAKTIEAGQLDMLATSRGPSGQRVHLLGLRLATSNRLASVLQTVLQQHRDFFETRSVGVTMDDQGKSVVQLVERRSNLEADVIGDHPVHRLPFATIHQLVQRWIPEGILESLVPEEGSLWIIATSQSIWFAWTHDEKAAAPAELKELIELLQQPGQRAASARPPAPFQFVLHGRDWPAPEPVQAAAPNQVQQADLEQDAHRRFGELVQTTFQERPDAIRCDIRPTETGLRMRLTLEEAYLSWFGLVTAAIVESETTADRQPRGVR